MVILSKNIIYKMEYTWTSSSYKIHCPKWLESEETTWGKSMESIQSKRLFLVAVHDSHLAKALAEAIENQVSYSTVYVAHDGADALMKMKNAPPHVIICDAELTKHSGLKITDSMLKEKGLESSAAIILGTIPDTELFVDEVVTGRVQFLEGFNDQTQFTKALTRALNFVSSSYVKEFHLRFLAPGDQLIHEGESGKNVYIVRRGTLLAFRTGSDGRELTLGKIGKGEFVGEMAYISGEKRSADVRAETSCELIELPIDLLDHMLFQKPSWAKALMVTLSKRVKIANQEKVKSA